MQINEADLRAHCPTTPDGKFSVYHAIAWHKGCTLDEAETYFRNLCAEPSGERFRNLETFQFPIQDDQPDRRPVATPPRRPVTRSQVAKRGRIA